MDNVESHEKYYRDKYRKKYGSCYKHLVDSPNRYSIWDISGITGNNRHVINEIKYRRYTHQKLIDDGIWVDLHKINELLKIQKQNFKYEIYIIIYCADDVTLIIDLSSRFNDEIFNWKVSNQYVKTETFYSDKKDYKGMVEIEFLEMIDKRVKDN
jgi:hypothetical protein